MKRVTLISLLAAATIACSAEQSLDRKLADMNEPKEETTNKQPSFVSRIHEIYIQRVNRYREEIEPLLQLSESDMEKVKALEYLSVQNDLKPIARELFLANNIMITYPLIEVKPTTSLQGTEAVIICQGYKSDFSSLLPNCQSDSLWYYFDPTLPIIRVVKMPSNPSEFPIHLPTYPYLVK